MSGRTKQVHCFLSPDEKDELAILAEVRGLSVSSYLRQLYLQDRSRYYAGSTNNLTLVSHEELNTNYHDPNVADLAAQKRSLAS